MGGGTAKEDVTQLLKGWQKGDPDAFERLTQVLYPPLREIAARQFGRERPNHTLAPTELLHEAMVKLLKQRKVRWDNRTHFFAVAAHIMRRVLVDHAVHRNRIKRGRDAVLITLENAVEPSDEPNWQLVQLEEALSKLEGFDREQAQIVELRFFGGLTMEEIADVLGRSTPTVFRKWRAARAWLRHFMQSEKGTISPD